MTCFWDGLMKGLKDEDFQRIGEIKKDRISLIKLLQKNNKLTDEVLWNNKIIKNKKELTENFEAVNNYNIKGIGNGHLCSTGDYMLMLICDIFCVNIYHKYLNKIMKYEKKNNKINLHFQSNKGHFWYKSRD